MKLFLDSGFKADYNLVSSASCKIQKISLKNPFKYKFVW